MHACRSSEISNVNVKRQKIFSLYQKDPEGLASDQLFETCMMQLVYFSTIDSV